MSEDCSQKGWHCMPCSTGFCVCAQRCKSGLLQSLIRIMHLDLRAGLLTNMPI